MAPSERLKPVRLVAQNNERDAAKVFGDAQRSLKDQEIKLEQLRQFHQEYLQRFEAAARVGMTAPQLMEYQAFMAKLKLAIEQQEATVEARRQEKTLSKEKWQVKHSRTEALGKVIDRYRKEEIQSQERREQKESDEHALRGALRSR